MLFALVAGVVLLSFANGANDNFKGVATLWGTGRYSYSKVLAWATISALAGSLFAIYASAGLIKVFNGSQFLSTAVSLDPSFPAAVALASAAAILFATAIGAPVSTTHALTGALLGAGAVAGGLSEVKWAAAAAAIFLPLAVSPLLSLTLTFSMFRLMSTWIARRDCICVTEPEPAALASDAGVLVVSAPVNVPGVRVAAKAECLEQEQAVVARWDTEEAIHWTSAAAISFSRTMNDTPKIAALMLTSQLATPAQGFAMVGVLMGVGGLVAARAVARTMSLRVTRIDPVGGMSANLVAALLVGVASRFGVPVSTTHVVMGGIFGVGLHKRDETDWKLVGQILLAWLVTMPLGLTFGVAAQFLLSATR